MRSVKTCPRSRSAAIWTSSTARNETSRSRDRLGADATDDLVVDLARQQPQRQPDHAGRMRQHPLDR
jgi:hypothetical protein